MKRTTVVIADIPRLGKGGVNAPRSKEAAKRPLKGAEGAVRSTSDYRRLERTAPSAPSKEPEHFIDARPPRLGQGGESAHLTHFRTETLPKCSKKKSGTAPVSFAITCARIRSVELSS